MVDVVENEGLNVVDVVDPQAIKLGLYHVKKTTVETFNHQNAFGVDIFQGNLFYILIKFNLTVIR